MVFFFYGTLMEVELLRSIAGAAACRVVGEGSLAGTLYDLGAYPGLVLRGSTRIPGVVCEVDDEVAARLDEYEGVDDGLYARRMASVDLGDTIVEAWTYEYLGRVDRRSRIDRWQVVERTTGG
jgi:gamma-glutamylcyclotransferase (GGCT)/AIG2-like uncharacterized protein YtfP